MIKYLLALSLLCWAYVSNAHEEHTQHQNVAIAVSVAFDPQGNLWRASVHDGFLKVSKSTDTGKTFSTPVIVNQVPQKIGAD